MVELDILHVKIVPPDAEDDVATAVQEHQPLGRLQIAEPHTFQSLLGFDQLVQPHVLHVVRVTPHAEDIVVPDIKWSEAVR